MNMLSCYILYVHSLLALLLNSHLTFCKDDFVENTDIFTDENLQRPELRIPQGNIQGVNMVSRFNRKFFGFQKIPFAQPPVGKLRFKAPVPAGAWNGTLDGSIDTYPCPQSNSTTIFGNEDCLYINVFTPQFPVTENCTLLPVLVFVFGGGFESGTNSPERYSPRSILDKDVVLVAPNYRMGVLGYLSTGDEISPGNYGLKDLVLALEWIQNNVRYFGGDPNQVTLMGQSSGAVNVHLLTLSDLTKGLFHRYIIQSTSALVSMACRSRQESAKLATQLGEYLNCPTNTSVVLVDCLRGIDAFKLVDTRSAFFKWYKFPSVVWGPSVEPHIEGALITDTPANLIAAGKMRDLSWMAGINRDEGIYLSASFYEKLDVFQEFLDNLDSLIPIVLQYDDHLVDNVTMYTDTLKSYYFNDLTADTYLLLANFTKLTSDNFFIYPTYNAIRQHLLQAKNPRYLYSFEYRGTGSQSYAFSGGSTTNWGVAHGDDLFYLLPGGECIFGPPGWKFDEKDWRMVDTMTELWTSFVIHGTPTISEPNSTEVWKPLSSQNNYLQIGNNSDIILKEKYNFYADRMRIWEGLDSTSSKHQPSSFSNIEENSESKAT